MVRAAEEEECEFQVLSYSFAGLDRRSQMTSVLAKKKNCGSGFCGKMWADGAAAGW